MQRLVVVRGLIVNRALVAHLGEDLQTGDQHGEGLEAGLWVAAVLLPEAPAAPAMERTVTPRA